eukprot:TRINITY_DN14916_c0_g1_i1.p1 TRINITY_DN14916_c0_g1~~TRINITY_DN14916_c0_g1_i1.p1  ORF type:complete len:217 (+),score=32.09 TRINITY_DN14916_c0_g1_i1:72-722(+)
MPDQTQQLPFDILSYIFSFLQESDYAHLFHVCRLWRETSKKQFIREKGGIEATLQWACKSDVKNVLGLILSDHSLDLSATFHNAIAWASTSGKSEVVACLIKDGRFDASGKNNYAIRMASLYGHAECVKELLKDPRVDPSVSDNYCIRVASRCEHLGVIRWLLQDTRVDQHKGDEEAIFWARRDDHLPIDVMRTGKYRNFHSHSHGHLIEVPLSHK